MVVLVRYLKEPLRAVAKALRSAKVFKGSDSGSPEQAHCRRGWLSYPILDL